MFKNIDEAIDWIVQRKRNSHSFELFKSFMEKLGNPQDDLKIIHVAGTNGKGSTVTFLRDMFINNGYHVGTLQSPHYLSHLDRIRLMEQIFLMRHFLEFLISIMRCLWMKIWECLRLIM